MSSVNKHSVAAVVVLYQPELNVIENIFSYIDQVDFVFVIDNSEIPNLDVVLKIKENLKSEYVSNNGNMGLAYALNLGANLALKNHFDFLLTMDQDTSLPSYSISRLVQMRTAINEKIGIITIKHFPHPKLVKPYSFVLFTMTSGNLLDLNAYIELGPFREDFFIDHIDHEYCLRLNSKGYKIVELNHPTLNHKPGEGRNVNLLIFKINYRIHSPIRLYYFTRNGFVVSKLYERNFKVFKRLFKVLLIRNILKCVFFSSDRIQSLKMIFQGYQDYRSNRMGRK